jgi:hypothetical protein
MEAGGNCGGWKRGTCLPRPVGGIMGPRVKPEDDEEERVGKA